MPSKDKLVIIGSTIDKKTGKTLSHYGPLNQNKYSPQGAIKTKQYRKLQEKI